MHWLSFERAWLRSLCEAILPDGAHPDIPGAASVPLEAFFDEFAANAPALSGFGVRAMTWLLTWMPLFVYGRPFGRLDPTTQIAFLDRLDGSRFYVLREAPGLIKLVACLAWAAQPDVQRALGVSRPDSSPPDWAVPR